MNFLTLNSVLDGRATLEGDGVRLLGIDITVAAPHFIIYCVIPTCLPPISKRGPQWEITPIF